MLLEKAFAKVYGSYNRLSSGKHLDALACVTGKPCKTISLHGESTLHTLRWGGSLLIWWWQDNVNWVCADMCPDSIIPQCFIAPQYLSPTIDCWRYCDTFSGWRDGCGGLWILLKSWLDQVLRSPRHAPSNLTPSLRLLTRISWRTVSVPYLLVGASSHGVLPKCRGVRARLCVRWCRCGWWADPWFGESLALRAQGPYIWVCVRCIGGEGGSGLPVRVGWRSSVGVVAKRNQWLR